MLNSPNKHLKIIKIKQINKRHWVLQGNINWHCTMKHTTEGVGWFDTISTFLNENGKKKHLTDRFTHKAW